MPKQLVLVPEYRKATRDRKYNKKRPTAMSAELTDLVLELAQRSAGAANQTSPERRNPSK
jgi:hypothetical protein